MDHEDLRTQVEPLLSTLIGEVVLFNDPPFEVSKWDTRGFLNPLKDWYPSRLFDIYFKGFEFYSGIEWNSGGRYRDYEEDYTPAVKVIGDGSYRPVKSNERQFYPIKVVFQSIHY